MKDSSLQHTAWVKNSFHTRRLARLLYCVHLRRQKRLSTASTPHGSAKFSHFISGECGNGVVTSSRDGEGGNKVYGAGERPGAF